MDFQKVGDSQALEGFCLLKSVEVKTTAKGSQYLDLTLVDNSGETNAKFWDYKETPDNRFERNDFVKVRGTFVPFNDTQQFRIDKIRLVRYEDNINISEYIPSAVLEGEVMLKEIIKVMNSFSDSELKLLVEKCIEKNKDKLLFWPAAKNLHHAIRGGLLMHTLTLVRLAEGVCKVYPFVNRDLLLAGTILHDFSKINELQSTDIGIAGEYTAKGNLLGHLVMGAMEIDEIGKANEISEDTLMLVEHMLISHHGKLEFGAAKLPMFLEAELLSEIDLMDARIYEMRQSISEVEPGAITPRQWSLENRNLYNHGRNSSDDVNLL